MALFRRKPETPPGERFMTGATELLARVRGVERVERTGPFELTGVMADGKPPTHLHLQNIWQSVAELPVADQLQPVAQMLEAVGAPQPTSWDDLAGIVVPSIKPVSWLAGQPADLAPIHRPIAPFLVEAVAIDMAHAMGFATPGAVETSGADRDRFFAQAHANLEQHALELVAVPDVAPGALAVLGPDGYESSWLVRPDLLGRVGEQLSGSPLVLAPTRSDLIIVSDDDPTAVAAALEWAMAIYSEAPRPLSPVAYELAGSQLAPWRPGPTHPCVHAAGHAERYLALVEYTDQTEALTELLHGAGEDVFVASYRASRTPEGRTVGRVVWPRTVTDGLLPEADLVVLVDPDPEDAFTVAWDDVVRIAGEWFVAEPWNPPRWRIRGWPPDAVVQELRDVAQTS